MSDAAVTVAAVGDLHVGAESDEGLAAELADVGELADALLLAGDLTRCGSPAEAAILAGALERVEVPVVAVLGNHDHHADAGDEVQAQLEAVGVHVLEADHVELDLPAGRLAVAGSKGFGGGFAGACASEFGEPEMRSFAGHGRQVAERFEAALRGAEGDVRIALLHYSPVPETLRGEHLEIYPFLGSYLLAEAIDAAGGADLVLHGHAHAGSERGMTPGGARVRNVARPVIRRTYARFELEPA